MGRVTVFILFVITLFSCKNQPGESKLHDISSGRKIFQPVELNLPEPVKYSNCFHDPFQIQFDEEGYAFPSLQIHDFSFSKCLFPLDISPDSVLFSLLPGRIYRDECSGDFFTCWKPSKQNHELISRKYGDEIISFPDTNGNESRWLDSVSWNQADGKQYLLLSFTTSDRSADGCAGMLGRFSPAWLGLALFRSFNSGWELIAFDPAVDLNGQFSIADHPHVLKTGFSSFLIVVNDHDAGCGSPLWKMLTLYAVKKHSFVPVSEKINSGVENRITEWETSVFSSDSLSKDVFPELQFVSSGKLCACDFESVGENCLVPEAAEIFKKRETMKFRLQKKMHYKNGKYVNDEIIFTPDTSWIPH